MSGRRPWMPWLAAVVIGHAAGSYGLGSELLGAVHNHDLAVPMVTRLVAPVWCLPILVTWTSPSVSGNGGATGDVVAAWVVYAVPFAAVLAVAPLASCWARRRSLRPQGFAPILPADIHAVTQDRRP